MPQGPAHLHEKFGDDGTAWAYLAERGFTHDRGVIQKPDREITEAEFEAIDYLCLEWDWAF